MDVKHLQYLTEIAKTGSLKEAAMKLQISSAALSRYLSITEEHIGHKIFIHGKKKFTPTEYGTVFLKYVSEILGIYNTALSGIHLIREGFTETIRVGGSPQRGELVISQMFNAFHQLHPSVQIQIIQAYSIPGKKLLMNNQIDFMFCSYSDSDLENFKIYSRWREPIVLVLPVFHPYATKRPPSYHEKAPERDQSESYGYVDIRDFSDSVYVMYNQNTQARVSIDEYLTSIHFRPSIAYESNSPNVIMNMVQQGNGIAFLPLHYAKQMKQVTIYQTDPPIFMSHGVLSRKHQVLTDAQKTFIQLYCLEKKEIPYGN